MTDPQIVALVVGFLTVVFFILFWLPVDLGGRGIPEPENMDIPMPVELLAMTRLNETVAKRERRWMMKKRLMGISYDKILYAPCVFCGYSSYNYWQSGSHKQSCPWFKIGGAEERRHKLRAILAEEDNHDLRESHGIIEPATPGLVTGKMIKEWRCIWHEYGVDMEENTAIANAVNYHTQAKPPVTVEELRHIPLSEEFDGPICLGDCINSDEIEALHKYLSTREGGQSDD